MSILKRILDLMRKDPSKSVEEKANKVYDSSREIASDLRGIAERVDILSELVRNMRYDQVDNRKSNGP